MPSREDADQQSVFNSIRLVREAITIRNEWLRLRAEKERKNSPQAYDHASSYLKRAVYRLACRLPDDLREAVRLIEKAYNCPLRDPASDKARFLGLLFLIDAQKELVRAEKHRYAEELLYAFRHRIPAELLVGFILQVGPKLRERVKDKENREEWFDKAKHTSKAFLH